MTSKQYASIVWIATLLLILALGGYGIRWLYQQEQARQLQPLSPPSEQQIKEQLNALPLRFEKNQGQVAEPVRFLVKNGSMTIFFTPSEVVYKLNERESTKGLVIRQTFVGASPDPEILGERMLGSKVNYFIGNDPSKWVQGGETYGSLRYVELYPGIDVVYSGISSRIEYAYELAPGADPSFIQVQIAGSNGLYVDSQGVLVLQSDIGSIAIPKPSASQTIQSREQEVTVFYKIINEESYGFVLGAYDATQPLRIQSQAN